jgi:hypothetical protein
LLKVLFDAPPLASLVVHAHGLLMTAWVVLFIAQIFSFPVPASVVASTVRDPSSPQGGPMKSASWRAASALTLAGVVMVSGMAAAQKPNRQKPRQVPQTDAEPATPVTDTQAAGEALLEQMTNRSAEGLVEVVNPDGAVSMDLQGRFMSVMVARLKADGSRDVSCETEPEAVKHATATATTKKRTAPATATVVPVTPAPREIK